MNTKIFSANITLGDAPNCIVLKEQAVKRLPVPILMSNAYFIRWIKLKIGDKKYDSLLNKKTKMLTVNVEYIKQIGIANQEPIIEL